MMTRGERVGILGLGLALLACLGMIATIVVGTSTADRNTTHIAALVAETRRLAQRVARDEYRTCVIQKRGLPAGHALSASMANIHALLTQKPRTAGQRAARQQEPLSTRRIVRDLNRHLARYTRLEASQPRTREC
jgi:hypothetical protein